MDNQALYGFRWVKSRTGSGTPAPEWVSVASAYQAAPGGVNVDLNIGDPVKKVNDGTVALAAAGDAIFGIVCDVGPYWDGTKKVRANRLPGGTTYGSVFDRESKVAIYLFADNIFAVVCDDASTATTQAAYQALVGENADITINQVSGDTHAYPKLDISDHKTGTAQCRLVAIDNRVDIDFTGANVPFLVTGNEVQQAPFQTTGV
jgi:hypothetical protein